MDILEYSIGVILFVLCLTFSIALHEVGHLVPAKIFGVRVTQYMVGFGNTIWSKTRGETEYGIKSIPLGGYIKMIGMFPPAKGAKEGELRDSSTGLFHSVIEDARTAEASKIEPDDHNRVFYKLPTWQKLIIMTSGPLMNLLLAVVFFAIAIMGISSPLSAKQDVYIANVQECVVDVTVKRTSNTCTPDDDKAPAAAAGLLPQDLIKTIDGKPVTRSEDMGKIIRELPGQTVPVVVERAGELKTFQLTPRPTTRYAFDSNYERIKLADGSFKTEQVGFIGVQSMPRGEPGSFGHVMTITGQYFTRTVTAIIRLPQKMVDVAEAAFSSKPRDPDGPIGLVGMGRISGEVASHDRIYLTEKILGGLMMAGGLNMFLFLFNMLPILPFDGGHAAGAIWESIRRFFAKIAGKPDPGPVDVAKALPVAYVMAACMACMTLLLLYADIVKPISIG